MTNNRPRWASRASAVRVGGALVILLATTGAARAGHDITISPSPIGFDADFDSSRLGAPPGVTQYGFFQITNTGTKNLRVTDIEITGPAADLMAFDAGEPLCDGRQHCKHDFSLAPGEGHPFSLTCTATQVGVFSASLVVKSNADRTTVPMSCRGNRPPIIKVSPTSLDFGIMPTCDFINIDCPSVTRTLTITNEASEPSELDFYISPIPSGPLYDFTVTPSDLGTAQYPNALGPGESFSVELAFHPRQSSVSVTQLEVVSMYPGQAAVVIPIHAETGRGVLAIDSPDGLGQVAFGQTLVTSITGHNAGNLGLFISRISTAGDCIPVDGAPLSFPLQPGEAFTLMLACTPTVDWLGAVEVEFDMFREEQDVVVHRFGVDALGAALVLSQRSLELVGPAAVTVGTSVTSWFLLTNYNFHPGDLISITSTDPRFTWTLLDHSLPLTLGPNEWAEFEVTFTPTAAETTSGTITFEVSLGLGVTLNVVGEGVLPEAGGMPRARSAAISASTAQPEGGGCSTIGGAGLPLILAAWWRLARRRRRMA